VNPTRLDSPVFAAVDDLSAAFAARDVAAALACFVAGDDIGYVGSEHTESATGRAALGALFAAVFSRGEAYSWQATAASVREYGDCAYLIAEAHGLARTDADEIIAFPYRISGLLEPIDGRWRWRHCHGCEPNGEADGGPSERPPVNPG
jgi:ketosteroid isomerase-like protein